MATQHLFTYTEADLVKLCNDIRELTIKDIKNQNIITEEQEEDYLCNRVFIGYRPSLFGKIWNKLNLKESVTAENGFSIMPITLKFGEEESHTDDDKNKVIKLVKDT